MNTIIKSLAVGLLLVFFSAIAHAQKEFAVLPKVELHLHLDCSLSYEVVQQLNPAVTPEMYRDSFQAPGKCLNLADYILRAVKGFELMQTREQLRLVTLDLFRQLKADNVIYAEIRFAPLQHIYKGLTPEEVVATADSAMREGMRSTGIEAGLILCTLRHFTKEQSLQTAKLAAQFKGTTVVGFDIAADEAGYPLTNHIEAYEYAHRQNIGCTAHAGEAKGAESVRETLDLLKPSRIGHGVRSIEDSTVIRRIIKENIHLEVCPKSNYQTNIYQSPEDHVIGKLYKAGVSLGVNTDGRTISDVTLTDEYKSLNRIFGWTKKELLHCNLEAIDHAFTTDAVKKKIRKKLKQAYR